MHEDQVLLEKTLPALFKRGDGTVTRSIVRSCRWVQSAARNALQVGGLRPSSGDHIAM